MKMIKLSLAGVMALGAIAASTASANTLENIISNPKLNLEIRPRYEYADVKNNGVSSAKAFTVRTAVGVNAELFGVEGLGAQIQMMNVSNFGWVDKYAPERTGYDKIVDPSQTRVTQANVSYTVDGFTAIVGRKMVTLDNHRFIGNVGWRQMPQTYDLAAVIYNGIENLSLLGAYVNRVHTVKKDDYVNTNSVLLHASYKVMPELTVTAYDYMIASFADHIGLRLTGKTDMNGIKVNYTAEVAKQTDATMEVDNSGKPDQDATYYNLNVEVNYNGIIAGVGYEVLGADDENKAGSSEFYTPLSTLHAMNGWADVFLNGTGTSYGLTDTTIKLGYNAGEYGKLVGIYHIFKSDDKSYDYGTEFDIAYNYKIVKNLGFLLKAAFFKGDDKVPAAAGNNNVLANGWDVTKYWIQLDYKFSAEF